MALAGRGGAVKFSSSTSGTPAVIADLREWQLNVEADMFEISTFGSSGWKEFQPNLNGASGTISGYFNVQGSTTMRAVMQKILGLSTSPGTLNVLVDNTNGNGFTGDAWITNISPSAAVDAIVPFTASVTYHGAVSYSTTL